MCFNFLYLLCGAGLFLFHVAEAQESWSIHEHNFTGWKLITSEKTETDIGRQLRMTVRDNAENKLQQIGKLFDLRNHAGENIVLSIKVKGEQLVSPDTRNGFPGKFQATYVLDGKRCYRGATIKRGSFDLEPVSFSLTVPPDGSFWLSMGMQNGTGTITFEDLSITPADAMPGLAKTANMGFADAVAGDGKGGWSDQGPDNDASGFDFTKKTYGNVPFQLINPAANGGKSILAFRSPYFAGGLPQADIPVDASGKYLYLLHTVCWGSEGFKGQVKLKDKNGAEQNIDVLYGRDIANQWNPRSELANAFPAATWKNRSGGTNGLYVSKFKLSPKLKEIVSVKLIPQQGTSLWLVAGITISHLNYTFPEVGEFTIIADERWKPLMRPDRPSIIPGSALDFSGLTNDRIERLIVNRNGRLVQEGSPDIPFRIFCTSGTTIRHDAIQTCEFQDHDTIAAYVSEIKRAGHNMYRMWLPADFVVVRNGKAELTQPWLDRFDYFVSQCRKNGIYLSLNAMSGYGGYSGIFNWFPAAQKRNVAFQILFDKALRQEWKLGMDALLLHVNPYTGRKLADDPVLAVITCYNEQEFAFIRNDKSFPWNAALQEWRHFAKDPEAALFTQREWYAQDENAAKINDFIVMKWREMLAWYKEALSDISYHGIITLWDMVMSMNYNLLRNDVPLVTMHGYHCHPQGAKSENVGMGSDLSATAALVRGVCGARLTGKPFFLNEFAHVFPNRHRYEEAFSTVAYAAFQGFDGIMRHTYTSSAINADYIYPWEAFWDPITRAQTAEMALLYLRGDVREADAGVRIVFSEREVNEKRIFRESVSGAQTRLALLCRFSLERSDLPFQNSHDLRIPLQAGGQIMENLNGAVNVVESNKKNFDLATIVATLKKAGILSPANKSDGQHKFESSTGELYLDENNSSMTINTPRFQGLCSPAGGKADLRDVKIDICTTDGSVSLASLHSNESIADSTRMLLTIATNALNSNMTFTDANMLTRKKFGTNPTLIETGQFRIEIKNSNAAALEVYPLEMNGARRAAIPVKVRDNALILEIDTAKLPDGPAVFFELATKPAPRTGAVHRN